MVEVNGEYSPLIDSRDGRFVYLPEDFFYDRFGNHSGHHLAMYYQGSGSFGAGWAAECIAKYTQQIVDQLAPLAESCYDGKSFTKKVIGKTGLKALKQYKDKNEYQNKLHETFQAAISNKDNYWHLTKLLAPFYKKKNNTAFREQCKAVGVDNYFHTYYYGTEKQQAKWRQEHKENVEKVKDVATVVGAMAGIAAVTAGGATLANKLGRDKTMNNRAVVEQVAPEQNLINHKSQKINMGKGIKIQNEQSVDAETTVVTDEVTGEKITFELPKDSEREM